MKDRVLDKQMTDVIVVGAGPAGISAAITLARAGKEVVVVERGNFAGSKNVFGGAIYAKPTAEIFPEFWKSAPIERNNTEHRYALLGENDGTVIGYKNANHNEEGHQNSFTVLRAKWDRWCADQAKNEGAYLVPETVVKELIVENGKVVGIKTEQEEFRAKMVIVADGVNSLLAKQIGFRKDIEPQDVALGVKEVIGLPKETIQDRFNVGEKEGVIYTILGSSMKGMLGLGYIYTNVDSVVIGIGVSLKELKEKNLKPYELLNELKEHPTIKPLIKDGDLKEYSAHLIPEGGYNSIPKLYGDGVMIIGDAAMLVNNVHWEGTNLSMMSGKFAAEAAIEALNADDYSEKQLKLYQEKLDQSFVMKDLKTYKDVIHTLEDNAPSFLGFYPEKINEFFNMFTSVDGIPKKQKYKSFIGNIFKEKSIMKLMGDAMKLVKLAGGVVIK